MVEKLEEVEDNSDQNMAKDKTLRACACVAILSLILAVAAMTLVVIIIVKPALLLSEASENKLDTAADSEKASDPILKDGVVILEALKELEMKEKTWVFAYDVPWGERNKIEDSGALGGLSVEIFSAVCAEAGMKCRHVVTPIHYCWDSENNLGEGLLNGWFDACAMYLRTVERSNMFRFTGDFYEAKPGQMYQLSTNSHQLSQISGLKVGVPLGWFTNPGCLNRNGLVPADVQEVDLDQLVPLLQAGTIDLAFVEEGLLDGETGLTGLTDTQQCALSGAGAMHTMTSKLPEWFGDAAEAVRKSGKLSAICARYPTIDNCNLN